MCESGVCVGGGNKPPGTACDPDGQMCADGACTDDGVCELTSIGNCTTPVVPVFPSDDEDEGMGLNGGEIAAIVIASILGLMVLAAAILLLNGWTLGTATPEECEFIADERLRRACYNRRDGQYRRMPEGREVI